jgi:hypothetical protein
MQRIGLLNGLPVRTVVATTKLGHETEINVSTDETQELVMSYLDINQGREDFEDEVKGYEGFDNQVMYYVPEIIFLGDREDLIAFLNGIDSDQGYE